MKSHSTTTFVVLHLHVLCLCWFWFPTAAQYGAVILQYDNECSRNFSILEQVTSRAMRHPELMVAATETNIKMDIRLPLSGCRSGSLYPFVEALKEQKIHAVVGAVADHVCEAAATLSSVHEKLYVSWSCTASSLSDKILYPTFARTIPSAIATARAVISLVAGLRWKNSALLAAKDSSWRLLAEELDAIIRDRGFVVRAFLLLDTRATMEEIKSALSAVKPPVKAIILSMDLTMPLLSNVLRAAEKLGWADGRFAFFVLHVTTTLYPKLLPSLSILPVNILRAVFVVTVVAPNATYGEIWKNPENVDTFQELLITTSVEDVYDFYRQFSSVSLLLTAFQKAHQETNGLNVSMYTRNTIFPTLLGLSETDEVGDLLVKFVLLDFWPNYRIFRAVADLNIDHRGDLHVIDHQWIKGIDWPFNRPLVADPDCIIQDVECSVSEDVNLSAVVGANESVSKYGSAQLCKDIKYYLGVMIANVNFREKSIEKSKLYFTVKKKDTTLRCRKKLSLKEMKEKILLTVDDIVLTQVDISKKIFRDISDYDKPDILKASHDSLRPHTHLTPGQSSRTTGSEQINCARLNGDIVHLKHFYVTTTFEVRRKAMNQLLQIYELRHENLNPFLGCISDPQQPALVWEHCSRKSLADVLANEDIKLDWSFKLSLLTDLVRLTETEKCVKYNSQFSD
ncbi:retinal guanylyl cyclase 2-like [Tachypleus tridentatus]|uniref:retinal guanylyl cyclase 2-like n=1 Tax=Tachypleus tridentatus TaxID=6853 RepID=UPI003FD3D919